MRAIFVITYSAMSNDKPLSVFVHENAIAVKESVKIKSIVLSLPENINYEMGRSL